MPTGSVVVGGTVSQTSAGVGILALLGGAFGGVGADVIMVVLSAMAGCFVSLSGNKSLSTMDSIKLMLTGIMVALCLSWALTGLVIDLVPSLQSPYTPSLIAMVIGFMANRLEPLFSKVANKVEDKVK